MRVLSLNDPIGIPYLVLSELGIKDIDYTATIYKSRVKENDIGEVQERFIRDKFPQIKISNKVKPSVDLLIANIPTCTSRPYDKSLVPFAVVYTRDMLKAIRNIKPKYYIVIGRLRLANAHKREITSRLPSGYKETVIDSCIYTPIHDQRYYWTNFKFKMPPGNPGKLQDYIEDGYVDREIGLSITTTYHRGISLDRYRKYNQRQIVFTNDKYTTQEILTKLDHNAIPLNYINTTKIRKLTPTEIAKLYNLPTNFFDGYKPFTVYKLTSALIHPQVLKNLLKSLPLKKFI